MAEIDDLFFANYIRNDLARLGNGLRQALLDQEFPQSQEQCPKETTELAQTGYVTEPISAGDIVMVEIGYGTAEAGDTAIYAVIQHENTALNHPNGGNAKYLEQPVVAGMPSILQRAAHAAGSQP